jgi:RNA-directed DNA polymerase
MAKGASESAGGCWNAGSALVNTGEPTMPSDRLWAEERVRGIQVKLHQWACQDPDRRFDDLFNLVADPAFLVVAWDRVRNNRGARSAGVDGQTAYSVETERGLAAFLAELRESLRSRTFRPLPVKERMIPKPGTRKRRRLGIPTVTDRVVQASLKLVLEPIFEADFHPCSYGFRPNRRAHDAIAEAHYLTSRSYEWVVEGDIEACFDEIDHTALIGRVRDRIGDKRVLALVKSFLKAGILTQDATLRDSNTGTPQGGILSPLLANIALSVLDEFIAAGDGGPGSTQAERARRRRRELPNYRLVRYADDFLVLISGNRDHAEELCKQVAAVLTPMGLRLSAEKTLITHIDEGFDFLGWRLQRHRKKGTRDRYYVYTYPAKKSVASITGKIKALCRSDTNLPLAALLHQLNRVLRGWTTYFRPGVSFRTFQYLRGYTWQRVMAWVRRKHRRITWKELRRRYCAGGWWPTDGETVLFNPTAAGTTRYRYRGTAIPSPWPSG